MLTRLISAFFARSSITLLNLAILLLSTRQLGSSIVGQISLLIVNIALVQIINEIYTGYALVHYIPKSDLRSLYRTGLLWAAASTLLLNMGFLVCNIGLRDFWLHGLILSFTITLHSFNCVILLAREKLAAYNFLLLFQPLVLLLILAAKIFVLADKTASSYLTALYVSYCASAIVSSIYLVKQLNKDTFKKDPLSTTSILKNGFVNQLGNLAHTLSNRFNYYMLSSIPALVGVYSSATSLIESVWIIGSSVAPVILTHVANEKDKANNSRVTFLLAKLSFLLSLVCVLVITILPHEFFTLLLGKDFSNTKTIMLHLAPGVLCISFSTVISHYFSGLGQQKVQLTANGLGLLTTLCSSYFLISRYGLIGACYAASLSYFVAALVLVIVFMKENRFHLIDLFRVRKDLDLLQK